MRHNTTHHYHITKSVTYVYFGVAFVLCTGRLEIFVLSYRALRHGRLDRDLWAELVLCNERNNH